MQFTSTAVNDDFPNDIAIDDRFLPENLVRNFKNPFVNDVTMMLIMLWWPHDIALLLLRIIVEMHFAQFLAISFDLFLHNSLVKYLLENIFMIVLYSITRSFNLSCSRCIWELSLMLNTERFIFISLHIFFPFLKWTLDNRDHFVVNSHANWIFSKH